MTQYTEAGKARWVRANPEGDLSNFRRLLPVTQNHVHIKEASTTWHSWLFAVVSSLPFLDKGTDYNGVGNVNFLRSTKLSLITIKLALLVSCFKQETNKNQRA